jgi:hypothetical protein
VPTKECTIPRRRLFLHVGAGKTGSSALQHAFTKFSGVLAAQGIRYPERPKLRLKSLAQLPIAGNASTVFRAVQANSAADITTAVHELIVGDGDILLSNEGLYITSKQNLLQLRQAAGDMEARILVFFRPQADRFVSGYLQALKAGKIANESVDEFALRHHRIGLHNWLGCAERLQEVFGNLRVCWYPAVIRGAGVVAEAFDWLGLPNPQENTVVNPSPGREAAIVLQQANKAGIAKRGFSDRFLLAAQQEASLGTKITLGDGVRNIIDSETRDANFELLRRFCPELVPERELKSQVEPTIEQLDHSLVARLTAIAASTALTLGEDQATVERAFGQYAPR